MKKANQEKGAPSDIKKGIQKDASVLGPDYLGKVAPFKASPCRKYRFRQNPHRCCDTPGPYVRRQSFSEWMCLIPVVFNRDDDVHVLLDPLFDPLMGRFPVGTFFLEHFPIGFHEDRGGWDIGGFGTSQPKRNQRGHLIGTGVVPSKFRRSLARISSPASRGHVGSRITISSPPIRATQSDVRTLSLHKAATVWSNLSPTRCPM